MKKNDVFTVKLTDTASNGCGFCKIDNIAVFVKNGVGGDECEIKIIKECKKYCIATVTKLIKPSEHRITPACTLKRCGGCVFQNISLEYEEELKAKFIRDTLHKQGLDNIKVNHTISCKNSKGYRNKAQFPVSSDKNGILTGFYAEKTHEIIKCDVCDINPPVFSEIANTVIEFAKEYKISPYDEQTKSGFLRHIYLRCTKNTKKIMLCIVTNEKKFPQEKEFIDFIIKKFPNVCSIYQNINSKDTNVVLGDKYYLLYGEEKLSDELCGLKFNISPPSFYQVNRECCEKLYGLGKELLNIKDGENVLDLYCGIGTVGMCTAKNAGYLFGIEINEDAVENAKENARINNIKNADFAACDASDTLNFIKSLDKHFDAVIVDPPRKGLDEEVTELVASLNPSRVLYISCDYSSLCRDLVRFEKLGYTTKEITPVNMFPRTSHIETVVLLSRRIT